MELILFGISREIVGAKVLKVAAENVGTVGALKEWLKQQYPQIEKLSSLAIAVNSEYADDSQVINSESEVAIIPPVSGG